MYMCYVVRGVNREFKQIYPSVKSKKAPPEGAGGACLKSSTYKFRWKNKPKAGKMGLGSWVGVFSSPFPFQPPSSASLHLLTPYPPHSVQLDMVSLNICKLELIAGGKYFLNPFCMMEHKHVCINVVIYICIGISQKH